MPSPLEEQVEYLARKYEKWAAMSNTDTVRGEVYAHHLLSSAEELRALLRDYPLEVTDEMEWAGAEAIWQCMSEHGAGIPSTVALSHACLSAALTQPQTEKVNLPDKEQNWCWCEDGTCVCCEESDGGGAATAAGARGADLEGEGVYEAVYACLDACGGTMGSTVLHFLADLDERGFRVVRADTEPTPYAEAFRERVCPVPEFPGIRKEES